MSVVHISDESGTDDSFIDDSELINNEKEDETDTDKNKEIENSNKRKLKVLKRKKKFNAEAAEAVDDDDEELKNETKSEKKFAQRYKKKYGHYPGEPDEDEEEGEDIIPVSNEVQPDNDFIYIVTYKRKKLNDVYGEEQYKDIYSDKPLRYEIIKKIIDPEITKVAITKIEQHSQFVEDKVQFKK